MIVSGRLYAPRRSSSSHPRPRPSSNAPASPVQFFCAHIWYFVALLSLGFVAAALLDRYVLPSLPESGTISLSISYRNPFERQGAQGMAPPASTMHLPLGDRAALSVSTNLPSSHQAQSTIEPQQATRAIERLASGQSASTITEMNQQSKETATPLLLPSFSRPSSTAAGWYPPEFEPFIRRFGRNPVVRPNGRPFEAPMPFPQPDMHAFLRINPKLPLKAWAPYVHHQNTIPYLRGNASFDEYVDFILRTSQPEPQYRVENAPPQDLYDTVDFSYSDPLIRATIEAGRENTSHIEGSFDWCMARGTPCRSCTVDLARDPAQPLCAPCTHCTAELAWPDTHLRGQPTFLARFRGDRPDVVESGTLVIKFLCVPSFHSNRSDLHSICAANNQRQPEKKLEVALSQVQSISLVREACGNFGNIAIPYWIAHVKSVTPEGEVVNQLGILMRRIFGKSLHHWYRGEEKARLWLRDKVLRIPHEQVLLAALHDFIMCEADRHTENVILDPERNTITLIDNDMELGSTGPLGTVRPADVGVPFHTDYECRVNSLFIPGNIKYYVYLYSPHMIASLDYRCHVNNTMDVPLPDPVRMCLTRFARTPPDQLMAEMRLLRKEWAVTLHRRARNILEKGFTAAVLLEQRTNFMQFKEVEDRMREAPGGWASNSLRQWRPWNDPYCPLNNTDVMPRWPRWPRPWDGEPFGPESLDNY